MWLVVEITPFLGNDIISSKHDIVFQHSGDIFPSVWSVICAASEGTRLKMISNFLFPTPDQGKCYNQQGRRSALRLFKSVGPVHCKKGYHGQ